MLFDMRGETVPKAAAISMVNRTLKDDGHSPSARDCVEIVDALAAADGNDRVLNFTALEFWTVADRVMYPSTCECESEREREGADDTVPAEARAEDYPGVVVQDSDGDFWKSNGTEWSLSLSLDEVDRGMSYADSRRLSPLFAPYARIEHLDSDNNEDRTDDTVPAEAHAKNYPGVVVQDSDGRFWKSDGNRWNLSLSLDEVESGINYADTNRLFAVCAPYSRVESLDLDGNEDRQSEDDDPVLFNLCRMIETLQRVLAVNDVSSRDLFGGLSAIDLAKFALPDGAWDAYESAKAAR